MHPTAALLALRGAVPMLYLPAPLPGAGTSTEHRRIPEASFPARLRIRGANAVDYAPQLQLLPMWTLRNGTHPRNYIEIAWEDISDDWMDKLDLDLVETFLSKL